MAMGGWFRMLAGFLVLLVVMPGTAMAQPYPAAAPAPGSGLSAGQFDQMVAPIALYPDDLLAQVLMAATYPLEVVEADRWMQDPDNAALSPEARDAAAQQQSWDPSVKSLVPFPQVLRMMDENLAWTEELGDAFLASQPAVMDAVQRLRQRASSAGTLQSTPQQRVVGQAPDIAIEPASPQYVYVPVYDPNVAYGPWPYPDYPPFFFSGFFDGYLVGAFGFGWLGVPIFAPLWGWNHWDWHHRRIDIDGGRFGLINGPGRPVASGPWQHDPAHRGGVPYRDAGSRARYAGELANPDGRRAARGYANAPAPAPMRTPGYEQRVPEPRQTPPPARAPEPRQQYPTYREPAARPQAPSYRAPAPPPVFESFGRGAEVRSQSARGNASRQSMPSSGGGRVHR